MSASSRYEQWEWGSISGGNRQVRGRGSNRAILQSAPWQGYVSGRHVPNHPAALFSPAPVVVRQVGTEDTVEQIVELFVYGASVAGDVDPDLAPDFVLELQSWLPTL